MSTKDDFYNTEYDDEFLAEDDQQEEPEEVDMSEATPVCPNCLEPIDPLDHYCKNCGEASGTFTPYIPYVNIHYNFSIFSRMWQHVWYEENVWWVGRIFNFLLILLVGIAYVPVMLLVFIVGLPFTLFRKRPTNSDDRHRND
jgi:hypothetical protein